MNLDDCLPGAGLNGQYVPATRLLRRPTPDTAGVTSLELKTRFESPGGPDSELVARLRPAMAEPSRAQHVPEGHPHIGKRTHAIRGWRVLFLLRVVRIVRVLRMRSGLFWFSRYNHGLP